jgi:hypothetical protein
MEIKRAIITKIVYEYIVFLLYNGDLPRPGIWGLTGRVVVRLIEVELVQLSGHHPVILQVKPVLQGRAAGRWPHHVLGDVPAGGRGNVVLRWRREDAGGLLKDLLELLLLRRPPHQMELK